MKTTPEGRGNTIAGGLGEPLARPVRELTEAEKRAQRRHAESLMHTNGSYKIWTDEGGMMHSEPIK